MNIQTLLHITQITTATTSTNNTNSKSTATSTTTTTQNKMNQQQLNNKSQVVTQQFVNDNETFSFQGKSLFYLK